MQVQISKMIAIILGLNFIWITAFSLFKVTGEISWSWFMVCITAWLPPVLALIIALCAVVYIKRKLRKLHKHVQMYNR